MDDVVQSLLRRQMEVAGSIREVISSPEKFADVKVKAELVVSFLTQLQSLSTQTKFGRDAIFTALIMMSQGEHPQSFDKQHRDGNIPMHQAKVLDRQAQLADANVIPTVKATVAANPEDIMDLDTLISACLIMRKLLRVKVEDDNDLDMAVKMAALVNGFLSDITKLAQSADNLQGMYEIYSAPTEQAMWNAIRRCNGESVAAEEEDDTPQVAATAAGSSSGSMMLGSSSSDTLAGSGSGISAVALSDAPPLPKDLVKGIQEKAAAISTTTKEPVPKRLGALKDILAWLTMAEQPTIDANCEDLIIVLHQPLVQHLAEKRSALLRVATDSAAILLIRTPPSRLSHNKQLQDCITQWMDILLKSVFVTVSAVATPTDAAVREILIATRGATYLVRRLLSNLATAPQAELRRKLVNYLCISVAATQVGPPSPLRGGSGSGRASSGGSTPQSRCIAELRGAVPTLRKMLSTGEAPVRKTTRLLVILMERCLGMSRSEVESDPKVLKAIEQQSEEIVDGEAQNVECVEVALLGLPTPSRACLYWSREEEDNLLLGHTGSSSTGGGGGGGGVESPKSASNSRNSNSRNDSSVNEASTSAIMTTTTPAKAALSSSNHHPQQPQQQLDRSPMMENEMISAAEGPLSPAAAVKSKRSSSNRQSSARR